MSNSAGAVAPPNPPDERSLLDHLRAARVFIEDCIVNGWDRGSLGNLYSARDEIDAAIAKAEQQT